MAVHETRYPSGAVATRLDGTGFRAWDADGRLRLERPATGAELAWLAEQDTRAAREQARAQALDAARTTYATLGAFLDLAEPTAADVVAQVRLLTRLTMAALPLAITELRASGENR